MTSNTTVRKVLFIDDEPMLVKLASALLNALGYEGAAYTRADEAIAAFREQPNAYMAAFTDLTMPLMSGFEVARTLLQIRGDLPVFVMSGNVGHEERSQALGLGAREVVTKPISMAQMREMLARLA
jgi:CheY-like chemotaxis protein